jgi:hypothetical protein
MESFTTVQSFRASILISIDLLNDEVIMKLLIWNLFFKLIVGVWLSFWGVSVFLHGMSGACPIISSKLGMEFGMQPFETIKLIQIPGNDCKFMN